MKRCTYCGREHPDEATVCLLDGQPLDLLAPPSAIPESAQPEARTGWVPQVLIPAVLWVLVNTLMISLYTIGASMLFGLVVALWAAVDCSKLQERGSRLLGIAFKPVVVFATVAFFLWGLGFVWYLIMRYKVKTAPVVEGNKAVCDEAGQR